MENKFNGKLKQRQIMRTMGWDSYLAGIWRLYHEEKMSGPEIAQKINEAMPKDFDGITVRSIQRALGRYCWQMGLERGTRTTGDAFRLAVSKGRVVWAYKLHKVKPRSKLSNKVRYIILTRDNFRCQLCGATADKDLLEVDHIIPRAQGGENTLENMRTLCWTCNSGRQALMRANKQN